MLTLANAGRADDIIRYRHDRSVVDARIQPVVTCEEVIQKCDAALEAKNKQIKKLELGLATQTERVADLSSQLEDKNSQLQSPFRNPFIMGTVGVLIGIVVTGYALK